ncbi:MAG: OsmC family protein [Acidobacteriota bacterium]|nr:MAG: OsmC family protein [Acidobacteriota bacterium]
MKTVPTPAVQIDLDWNEGLLFESRNQKGRTAVVDGTAEAGLSPMEGLLSALAGCMAVDVIDILTKMRLAPEDLSITANGQRNSFSPKYFSRIHLVFSITGAIPRDRIERAVSLSFSKYCSVFHCLRRDTQVTWELEQEDAPA